VDKTIDRIIHGQTLTIRVSGKLNGLRPEDVAVECLVGKLSDDGDFVLHERLPMTAENEQDEHGHLFCLDMKPRLAGLQQYQLRMYPRHALLCHEFELGLMVWL
jgi:starch phosphorylase